MTARRRQRVRQPSNVTAGARRPSRKKRGLLAKQMLNATDSSVLDKALDVYARRSRIGQERSGIIQARGTARDAGREHQWKVRLKSPLFKTLWVSCSCEYHMFHCEYALTEYGASSIINSNGEPPVVTNPRMVPKVCKHIAAVLQSNITEKLVSAAKRARSRK